MLNSTQALRDCKRCGDVRQSPKSTGNTWERQAEPTPNAKPRRPQWALRPSDGDIVGRRATRAERKALRKRYLQERAHDGKPGKFPK